MASSTEYALFIFVGFLEEVYQEWSDMKLFQESISQSLVAATTQILYLPKKQGNNIHAPTEIDNHHYKRWILHDLDIPDLIHLRLGNEQQPPKRYTQGGHYGRKNNNR